MSPMMELRLWLRRGPAPERAAAAVVIALLLSLVAWSVVPVGGGASVTTGAFTAGPAAAPAGSAAPATPTGSGGAAGSPTAPSGGPAPAGTAAAAGATGGAGGITDAASSGDRTATELPSPDGSAPACVSGETDPGVSADTIQVAVTLYDVFGANSTIDVASPDEQRAVWDAMFDSVNQAGGVQCRQLVARFYEMNPLEQSSQRAACLRIAEEGNFAVVGAGGFFPQSESLCVPQHGIPLFALYGLLPSMQDRYYPLVFSAGARVDTNMRTWVVGARDAGFFDPAGGFARLGVFENNCDPEVGDYLHRYLAEVGIDADSISTFVADCPLSGQTPPSQCAQAAVQHKLDGVTHVLLNGGGSANFCYVNNALRQNFRPRYSTSDYQLGIAPQTVGEAPNPGAFDGALGITLSRMGHYNAGLPSDAGSVECNQWFTSHGLPAAEQEDAAALSTGGLCSQFQMFLAAAAATPSLRRADLAAGLATSGPRALAWPSSDAVFDRPGKVTGSDFYRVTVWHADCTCWKVTDPVFKPAIPG